MTAGEHAGKLTNTRMDYLSTQTSVLLLKVSGPLLILSLLSQELSALVQPKSLPDLPIHHTP